MIDIGAMPEWLARPLAFLLAAAERLRFHAERLLLGINRPADGPASDFASE